MKRRLQARADARVALPGAGALACMLALAAALMLAAMNAASAAETPDVTAGRALAQQRCGECHVVVPGTGAGWTNAPTFQSVAGRPGMSAAWLTRFIPQDHAHMINYNFNAAQLREISAYIMSLSPK